jgi:dTDP-glucose pyrophosphorylase
MHKSLEHITITEQANIRDALRAIDRAALQLALVVDKEFKLIATVTDGDIRRGLLRGITLDQSIVEVMRRNPVCISLEAGHSSAVRLMRERKLHHIPVVDSEGRLAGLELIDDAIVTLAHGTWVVLMAGGLGIRLRPLTEQIPKPMLLVGGRPILETIITGLARQGFERFFISVNYQRRIIQDHFKDGSHLGVTIDYLVEQQRLGTAGPLSLLPQRPQKPILVMNADLLTVAHFTHLLQFHQEQGADATLCAREHVTDIPFGVVKSDGTRLTGIEEKPMHTAMINAGVYVLNPKVLEYIPSDCSCDMPDVLRSLITAGGTACVFPLQEFWLDIGRHEDLSRANAEFNTWFDT